MSARAEIAPDAAVRRRPFVPFSDGRRWDLLDPDPETLDWRDLALRLARIPRWGGATQWSIAEHSLLVAKLCPPGAARGYALLHDAHEGLLGDWVTPVKASLRTLCAGHALDSLEIDTSRAIHAAAGLPYPAHPSFLAAVATADFAALATEARDLLPPAMAAVVMADLGDAGLRPPSPAPLRFGRLKPAVAPETVAQCFLDALVRDAGLDPERAR